jgi:hypothetical protein
MATSNGTRNSGAAAPRQQQSPQQQLQPLEVRFPVHSSWKLTLSSEETVQGRIYCTDEASQSVVLQTALTHTTLASEIRIIQASGIVKSIPVKTPAADGEEDSALSVPLPKIQKKVLEDRERRAVKLAEESLRHINEKVCILCLPCCVEERLLCRRIQAETAMLLRTVRYLQLFSHTPYRHQSTPHFTGIPARTTRL